MTACKESILSEPTNGVRQKLPLLRYAVKTSKRIVTARHIPIHMHVHLYIILFFQKQSLNSWTESSCDHLPRSSAVSRQTTQLNSMLSVSTTSRLENRRYFQKTCLSKVVAINLDLIAEEETIILLFLCTWFCPCGCHTSPLFYPLLCILTYDFS